MSNNQKYLAILTALAISGPAHAQLGLQLNGGTITGATGSFTSLSAGGANVATQSAITVNMALGSVTLNAIQLGYGLLSLSGALPGSETVTIPSGSVGSWTVVNNTTGAYALTILVAGQATPLTLAQGTTRTISSDGTTLYSPISQAVGLATPTATTTSDLASFGGTTGQSLTDSGYSVGTSGNAVAALNGANTWTGYQTFNGGTNLAANVGSMLINGDMDIDQQFEGQSNGVGVDRFYYAYSSSSGMGFQRITGGPAGYAHYLKIFAPSTGVAVAGTDQRWLRSAVEGSMVEPLQWGTANGQPATLSFWAEASVAGTYAFSIVNSTPNYSYVGTYTISTANTWTQFNLVIPAPPTGSPWSNFVAGNYGLALRFDIGSGSTYATSSTGVWQSGNYGTTSGAVELVSNSAATLYLTGVHLFAGTSVGAYVPRPYAQELALAKRYYAKTFNEGVQVAQNAGLAGALCTRVPAATSYPSAYFALPSGIYTGSGSSPLVTTFNPSNSNANWRDVTAAADVTASVDPASAKGGTGVGIATSSSVATAGDNLCIQATYDAGFK